MPHMGGMPHKGVGGPSVGGMPQMGMSGMQHMGVGGPSVGGMPHMGMSGLNMGGGLHSSSQGQGMMGDGLFGGPGIGSGVTSAAGGSKPPSMVQGAGGGGAAKDNASGSLDSFDFVKDVFK